MLKKRGLHKQRRFNLKPLQFFLVVLGVALVWRAGVGGRKKEWSKQKRGRAVKREE